MVEQDGEHRDGAQQIERLDSAALRGRCDRDGQIPLSRSAFATQPPVGSGRLA